MSAEVAKLLDGPQADPGAALDAFAERAGVGGAMGKSGTAEAVTE
jgi:hypothetical protein